MRVCVCERTRRRLPQVVMMGDKGVGKSSLVQRFTKGTFIDGVEVRWRVPLPLPAAGWRWLALAGAGWRWLALAGAGWCTDVAL